MSSQIERLRVKLFYSYSHKDTQFKSQMETVLSLLGQEGLLRHWSDAEILPGTSISAELESKQAEFDVFAFLISPDWLASDECKKEWERAKQLADGVRRLIFRVPIIIRECPWHRFLGEDDVKALPNDGQAVTSYADRDVAWREVHDGIEAIVGQLRNTHTPKETFLEDFRTADIPTSEPVNLRDIFIFPRLTRHDYSSTPGVLDEQNIKDGSELLEFGSAIIHGEDKSGKTALARQMYLSLVESGQPVLIADCSAVSGRLSQRQLSSLYQEQFNGDYGIWIQGGQKTLIIDNMNESPQLLDFVTACSNTFERILVFVHSDIFQSYLMNEKRLGQFEVVRIDPLTRLQQERLIRKGLSIIVGNETPSDGLVDLTEDRVNSIIISNRIVPRYPFFVLAILQNYGTRSHNSLAITSYGHCYYVFILASLKRSGISESDDALNASFNFLEQLALETFERGMEASELNFSRFVQDYQSKYFIEEHLVNRLTHRSLGVLSQDGRFKSGYMYYFFLGKLIAADANVAQEYLPTLCEHSYVESNFLTLLFAIHHASDQSIIEEILLLTMTEFDDVPVATLDRSETSKFKDILKALPESVLSDESVEIERARNRARQHEAEHSDHGEADDDVEMDEDDQVDRSILRVLKNNKILGQVLRNQYGKLQKDQIELVVETVADSCLRLVNLFVRDEEELQKAAEFIRNRWPAVDESEVRKILEVVSFVWTMMNLSQAVHAVGVPSIRDAVEAVVAEKNTPAYDIFGYFSELDNAGELTMNTRNNLRRLNKAHDDNFIRRILSLQTQEYMNTHGVNSRVAQAICAELGIKYVPRSRGLRPSG